MAQENRKLAARIAELGFSQAELARQINAEVELLTGKPGNVTDADIRRWLRGATKWPQDRIRLCVEKVLDASAEDLGFVPRKKRIAPPEDDPVNRRALLTATGGTALAIAAPYAPAHGRLGIKDVRRFHQDYVAILRHDQAVGGSQKVENLAVELAAWIQSALAASLSSTRVRAMLYRLAANVISSAAFASIDASSPQRARAHLDKALTFASLSRDSETMYHVWNHLTLTSSQRENHAEAVAGTEVMKRSSIARRDPLYVSLGHIRNANGLARLRRRSEALRALSDAERAFARSTDEQRTEWIKFFDASEVDALSSFIWSALGDHGRAEYCLHRTLAAIPDGMVRNKALYTAHLSLAQARQGDLELACATGRRVHALLLPSSGSRRTAHTLAATRKVIVASGSKSPEIVEWVEETSQWM
ncbi:XRE family transcriptional regulator [Streptomyces sp. XD-27]|uniref:XRE family transcriptional regulator n=1 Tax=Streptomyces sp. XD-27 TaxID=3062779 RepID=UPI0026F425C1|nr:XRE family transcriptional regulator [Streptomyces sp. XD-27]WKX73310.1 XRE family transcriptional regulator [Streptomyces sp. XD-27]